MLSGSDHNEGSTVPEHANPASEDWRFNRPELDVLRLLAFLLVFVHHAGLAIFGCLLLMRRVDRVCNSFFFSVLI
jgi:peptidoglycan/LPS O-acetylase OafA/YrhL